MPEGSKLATPFFRAVRSEWGGAVTGPHAAPYWIGGLLLSAVVPIFAWDQTSSVLQKVLIATGLPILLFFSSIWVAGRKAWEAERNQRHRAEAELAALQSRQLTVEFTPTANNGSEWISGDLRVIQYRARVTNNSPQTIHGCGGQFNKVIRREDEGLADGYFENPQLTWSVDETPGTSSAINQDLPSGRGLWLNLIQIHEAERVWFPISRNPSNYKIPSQEPGHYECEVKIFAQDAEPKTLNFVFYWPAGDGSQAETFSEIRVS